MPLTKDELDSFYEYATGHLGTDIPSIEECFFRWRNERVGGAVDLSPFPDGQTLQDRLRESGVLGCGSDNLPDDLSTNPRHMEGFGTS